MQRVPVFVICTGHLLFSVVSDHCLLGLGYVRCYVWDDVRMLFDIMVLCALKWRETNE